MFNPYRYVILDFRLSINLFTFNINVNKFIVKIICILKFLFMFNISSLNLSVENEKNGYFSYKCEINSLWSKLILTIKLVLNFLLLL